MEIHCKICKTIGIAFLAFMCAACADDKGNYDYHELDEPEIDGIPAEIEILSYEQLTIQPQFNGGHADVESDYQYEWKAINRNEDTEVTLLSETQCLDVNVTLEPGIYTLFFTVTNRKSGLIWRRESKLTVSDPTTEGWMVLCSDNGRTRLDFISTVTQQTYQDILKDKNLPPYQGPRKIQWLSSMTNPASPYYLLTDEGATRLGRNGFEWKPEYAFNYEVATGENLKPAEIVSGGFGKVIVSDGKARYCEVMGIDGLYGTPVNKNFEVAPRVGVNVSALMYAAVYLLYDTTNKRFMAYCPLLAYNDLGNQNPLQDMDAMGQIAIGMQGTAGVVGSAFSEYPTGLDYVYMENTRYDPGNAKMGMTYTLLTDGSHLYLYGIQLGDFLLYADCTYVFGKSYFGDLSLCDHIMNKNNLFAFSSLKNYLYYASGNTVYRVNLNVAPIKAERQFTLDNETITCLKFNLFKKTENNRKSYDLIVGSEGSDGNSSLRIYPGLDAEGDFSGVTPTRFTGFKTIVDATYKERIN